MWVGRSVSLPSFMILVPSLVPTLGPAYASEHHPGVLVPSLSRSGPGVPLPVLFPITRAIQLHFLWQVRRAIMINIILLIIDVHEDYGGSRPMTAVLTLILQTHVYQHGYSIHTATYTN